MNLSNRLKDAITSYDRAIELNPNDAKAYHNRGKVKIIVLYV